MGPQEGGHHGWAVNYDPLDENDAPPEFDLPTPWWLDGTDD